MRGTMNVRFLKIFSEDKRSWGGGGNIVLSKYFLRDMQNAMDWFYLALSMDGGLLWTLE
jgi:hypothetical protein